MKTIIKVAIAALILNGLYHLGVAYWAHYQFEDSVQKAIQFSQRATTQELTGAIMTLAEEQGIPLDAENVQVTRNQRQVTVDAAYDRSIAILPRYSRSFEFTMHVSVLMLN